VGLPLLGLLGVLRLGRGLQAPPSVDGTWRTDSGGAGRGLAALLPLGRGAGPVHLEVRQSGTYLSLEIGWAQIRERLERISLTELSTDRASVFQMKALTRKSVIF
jgi:hypothetical protein